MATLYLVSTPIGNLGDLSPRAAETLGSVARILAEDTRRTRTLLRHLDLDTPLISLHTHNEASRREAVLDWLGSGEDLALVSDAGTPLVSDPGQRMVEAALEEGFQVVPIPGPSAVLAVLAGSGFPGDRFSFLGFLPRKGQDRMELLERTSSSPDPVVLFESPERIKTLLDELIRECGPDRRVAVGRELTKLHEEFIRGTLQEVRTHFDAHAPRGEFAVVVSGRGEVPHGAAVDEEAVKALAGALLADGLSPSRTAREVARRLRLPRNLVYPLVLGVTDQGVDSEATPDSD